MEENKDMGMEELNKMLDKLDKDILKIKIPTQLTSRLDIIEQQLRFYKERLVYYETKVYGDLVSKEKKIEDIKEATTRFRFFLEQKELELNRES